MTAPRRQLWLVRHAQPLMAPGHCYGALDVPADPAATTHSARQLASALPQGLIAHHSPLQRCELLAQILLGLRPDLIYTVDDRLREMDFGAWELRPWDEVPRADMDAWLADFTDARPGGDGESVRTLMARVGAAWDDTLAAPPAPTLWVTHAGVMRAAMLLSLGVRLPAQAADWPDTALAFGEVVQLPLSAVQAA